MRPSAKLNAEIEADGATSGATQTSARYRLKQKFVLRALEVLALTLDRPFFRIVHEFARHFHLVVTRRLLEWHFRVRFKSVTAVVLRNSSLQTGNFHCLLSDLDIAIVIRDELAQSATLLAEIAKITACAEALAKWFLLVGEAELYFESEFGEKQTLETQFGELLETNRLIRKAGWIETADRRRETPFHRLRSQRSWKKIAANLEQMVEAKGLLRPLEIAADEISLELTDLEFSELFESVAHYIGPAAAKLNQKELAKFLVLLPSLNWQLLAIQKVGTQTNAGLLIIKRAFARIEAIQSRSKAMSFPHLKGELERWAVGLDSIVAKIDQLLHSQGRLVTLDVHGVKVQITARTSDAVVMHALSEIERDFATFATTHDGLAAPIVITVGPHTPGIARVMFKIKTSLGVVEFGRSAFNYRSRSIKFHDQSTGDFRYFKFTRSQFRTADFFLNNRDSWTNIENYIHSSVGELLERRGYFRLHAAGRIVNDQALLYFGSSGTGKSELIRHCLSQRGEHDILGDEMILIRAARQRLQEPQLDSHIALHALAYPVPVATVVSSRTSSLTDRSRLFLGVCKELTSIPPDRVAKGELLAQIIAVFETPDSRWRLAAQWIVSFTLGLGLAQMREYLIRIDLAPWLIGQAIRRARFAHLLLTRSHVSFISRDKLRSQSNPKPS